MEFLILALFLGIGIILFFSEILKKLFCTNIVSGKVIDMKTRISTDNGSRVIHTYPIYEYEVNGEKYTRKSTNTRKFYTGQTIDVHYNPLYPRYSYITISISNIIMGIFFIILSLPSIGSSI